MTLELYLFAKLQGWRRDWTDSLQMLKELQCICSVMYGSEQSLVIHGAWMHVLIVCVCLHGATKKA